MAVYHRLESPTQTPEDAERQQATGEIWGRPARGSDIPSVKAYLGPLPEGARGVEFTTDVAPGDGKPPPKITTQVQWYYPNSPGVVTNDRGLAVLPVKIVRNTQSQH